MTNRSTKKALLMSALSLVVCITLLVGSTFAWFTDSVTSANNIIQSGNLDVELYYMNDVTADWTKVDGNTNVFKTGTLWEPGHTEVVKLKVVNEGSLALKYQLGVNVVSEVESVNVNDKPFKLSDYIYFGVVDGNKTYTREQAITAVNGTATKLNAPYTKADSLLAKNDSDTDENTVTMVVYMPETVGNDANFKQGAAVPTINLGISLYATQFTYESDSFGIDYDALAEFVPAWDGSVGEVPAEEDGKITISTAAELAAFAKAVNSGTSYSGKTVVLANDINLGDNEWTPIGACDSETYFQGTFDGQGNTVFNMTVDKSNDTYMYSTAGFFGWIDIGSATIKNLKFANASVKGSHWVGTVAGYMTGTVENCEVTDSTVVGVHVNDDADGDKIGGLVGLLNKGALKNNTVSASTISGNRDIGGLVGSVTAGQTLTGNKVTDTDITYITEKSYASAGEIISGRTGFVPDATNVATNVIVYKGELVAEGVVKTANNSYDVISKEGLLNANAIIANSSTGEGRGIKVKLLADIDLAGETWKPIDKMWVEFDGNGHTISNLTANAWKAGLFGYVGGGSIKNLTLENVNVTGAQAGAFAGAIEGTIDNCVLKGDNVITYTEKHQFDDPSAGLETWGGIGAISGITQPCKVNATIAEGAKVTLDYGAIETEAAYADQYVGYIGPNNGTVVNKGTVIAIRDVATTAAAQNALNNAKPGDVINLAAGNYDTLTVKNFWGGNYTQTGIAPITIKGGEGVTVGAIDLNGMNFVNIEDITFDSSKAVQVYAGGASGDYGNIVDSANDESKSRGANHITVKNCVFTGTPAVEIGKFCPINFMGSNPSSWTYNITVSGCKFFTNAQNFIRMNNVTNNGSVVIENNTFGGAEYITNHHAINASANGGDWTIKGNTFINWNPKKCAFATGRSSAEGTTDFVITGNTFSNTRIPTAADGDDGVIEIKTNSYTTTNQTLVFENNTFAGALAGLDESTVKYVKP